jgi:peptidoglycan/xylan/chitin deacetylase (PgdA/CDA1 family)
MSFQFNTTRSLKNLVKNLLFHSGYYKLKTLMKTGNGKRLQILMYHDLLDSVQHRSERIADPDEMTGHAFAAQVAAIKKHYRIMTVGQAIAEVKQTGNLAQNTVAITFDDGFASVYDIAWPQLRERGCSATVFLLTDWINGNMSLWWEDLADMVRQCNFAAVEPVKVERLFEKAAPGVRRRSDVDIRTWEGFAPAVSYILMQLPDESRKDLIEKLRPLILKGGKYIPRVAKPLTWDQIREMVKGGVEFAGHTCSHVNMSHIGLQQAEDEIRRSTEEIEEKAGVEVRGFAYPYGYDYQGYLRFQPVFEKLNLDYACTSWWGNNGAGSNPYILFRNVLPSQTSMALLGRELHLNMAEPIGPLQDIRGISD